MSTTSHAAPKAFSVSIVHDDAYSAGQEAAQELRDGMGSAPELVMFFFSADFDAAQVTAGLRSELPASTQVVGCSSYAEVGQDEALTHSVTALGMRLPLSALIVVLLLLSALNLWLGRVLRSGRRSAWAGALPQLLIDMLALTLLLALSGASANPFASLYLIPVALAAGALPLRQVIAVASGAALAYSALMLLPAHMLHVSYLPIDPFALHLVGMWINFLLTTLIFVMFLARLAETGRRQSAELADLRERQLRDESLLGMGLLAASTAHELNTPLQSMRLLLDDARGGHRLDAEDLDTLSQQLERCQLHVRTLAELARNPRQPRREWIVAEWLTEALTRWQTLHPTLQLHTRLADTLQHCRVRIDATLTLALLNLLDNAAQAGARAGHTQLHLYGQCAPGSLLLEIADRGGGWYPDAAPANPGGLGLGLKLSNASIERAGGSVELLHDPGAGTITRIVLPTSSELRSTATTTIGMQS